MRVYLLSAVAVFGMPWAGAWMLFAASTGARAEWEEARNRRERTSVVAAVVGMVLVGVVLLAVGVGSYIHAAVALGLVEPAPVVAPSPAPVEVWQGATCSLPTMDGGTVTFPCGEGAWQSMTDAE